ncbi:uncharacterized protein PAC_01572 [Phialocephala subalpina]|uniref:Uncharacterized protein n=1 Tax=Phialocephala subalpina TaxID=576137 RepID=A0A1L7WFZ4_9HELO|nr:uncharacterized protein PAC_01572 [Phialocephala subalpina]
MSEEFDIEAAWAFADVDPMAVRKKEPPKDSSKFTRGQQKTFLTFPLKIRQMIYAEVVRIEGNFVTIERPLSPVASRQGPASTKAHLSITAVLFPVLIWHCSERASRHTVKPRIFSGKRTVLASGYSYLLELNTFGELLGCLDTLKASFLSPTNETRTDFETLITRIYVLYKIDSKDGPCWDNNLLASQGCDRPEILPKILSFFRMSAQKGVLKSVTMITPMLKTLKRAKKQRNDFMTDAEDRELVQEMSLKVEGVVWGEWRYEGPSARDSPNAAAGS